MTRRLESPEEAAARLAGEALTEREQAQLWRRIAASTEAARRRRRTALALAWAVTATTAVASAAMVWLSTRASEPPGKVATPAAVDPCALDAHAAQLALPARCAGTAVQIDGDVWLLDGGAEIARVDGSARVVEGRVRFRVRPRTGTQAPFRVRVSHGEVRVIGTVFQIEQQSARGSVAVSEGVIEFVWQDGTRERVAAGQTLHWPRPAPSPEAADAGTTPAHAERDAGARADLDRAMERLLQLKSQKRHGEAVALLRSTLANRGLTSVQRERISYELGLSLEAAGQPSCPHWRRHLAQFGDKRGEAVLAERIARCRDD